MERQSTARRRLSWSPRPPCPSLQRKQCRVQEARGGREDLRQRRVQRTNPSSLCGDDREKHSCLISPEAHRACAHYCSIRKNPATVLLWRMVVQRRGCEESLS